MGSVGCYLIAAGSMDRLHRGPFSLCLNTALYYDTLTLHCNLIPLQCNVLWYTYTGLYSDTLTVHCTLIHLHCTVLCYNALFGVTIYFFCVTVHCSALQWTVLHYNDLFWTSLKWLQPILMGYSGPISVTVHCYALQYTVMHYGALFCVAVQGYGLQCTVLHYSALSCIKVHCTA